MKFSFNIKCILPIATIILAGCSSHHSSPVTSSVPPLSSNVSASADSGQRAEQGRLGTQWGENISSSVTTVEAQRITSKPTIMASIYYNDNKLKDYWHKTDMVSLQKINMDIEKENGGRFTMAYIGQNTYQLKAKEGQRYKLYFYNSDPKQSYEVVTTVDGIDVMSGKKGSVENRGYVIYPKKSLMIEGFRKSGSDVAAFRFSKPEDSYAAHSVAGDVNNTGIIGVAVYPTTQETMQKCGQQAFPKDNGYAPEPCNKD